MGPVTVGLLHPGAMGTEVGRILAGRGCMVLWCPDGRSPWTLHRAQAASFHPTPIGELCGRAEVIVSLCPPPAADDVARVVTAASFRGLYLEANAISPSRLAAIASRLGDAGVHVVDGCLIGPLPRTAGTTRLYLSGPGHLTATVSRLFAGSRLETLAISDNVGAASALKIAHSSFAKASRVLSALAHALAHEHGVGDVLTEEARRRSRPALAEPDFLPSMAARAWRWAPELADAADAFRAAGIPDTMVRAAGDLLRAWADLEDTTDPAALLDQIRTHPHHPATPPDTA